MFLFFQVFEDFGFQVGAPAYVHDLENGCDRIVVIDGFITLGQLTEAREQML
jgi:hypothetical protein